MKIPTIAAIRKAANDFTGERIGVITEPSIMFWSGPVKAAKHLKQTLRDWRKEPPTGDISIPLNLYELERDSEGFWIGGGFLEKAHLQYNRDLQGWELTSLSREYKVEVI